MTDYTEVLEVFKENVMKKFRDRILKIVVYGSVARGETGDESDIDVLVVVDKLDSRIEGEIIKLAFEAGKKIRKLITPLVVGEDNYKDMQEEKYPFILNIEREGITLA